MAILTAVGTNCDITAPSGFHSKFDRLSLTIGQRLVNTTGFGDTYEANTGGLKFGRGTVTGSTQYNAATTSPGFAALSGTSAEAVFQFATGCTVTVNILFSDITGSADVNSESRITHNFVTDGAIVEVWDES